MYEAIALVNRAISFESVQGGYAKCGFLLNRRTRQPPELIGDLREGFNDRTKAFNIGEVRLNLSLSNQAGLGLRALLMERLTSAA